MEQERELSFKFPLNLEEYMDALRKFCSTSTTATTHLPFKIIIKHFNVIWKQEESVTTFPFYDLIEQHIGDGKMKCSKCNFKNLVKLKHLLSVYSHRDDNSSDINISVVFRSIYDKTTDVNYYTFQIKFITSTTIDYFLLDRDLVIGQNKSAIEFTIVCPILHSQFKTFLTHSITLIRNHGYLRFISSCCHKSILMRLALERKFIIQKIGQDKCFLHVEWEQQQHCEEMKCLSDSRFKCHHILADAIAASSILAHIVASSCHFQRQYDIAQVPDILPLLDRINLKRRYNEYCPTATAQNDDDNDGNFFYCARKLDGIRQLLLLTHASWYILNGNFIAIHGQHLLRLKFNYICHVEFIQAEDRFCIIDVLQLIQLDNNRLDKKWTHECISILAAVQFINNLVRSDEGEFLAYSVCGHYTLSCNHFKSLDANNNHDLRKLDHGGIIEACSHLFKSTSSSALPQIDGYIFISEMQIFKIKYMSTIDLRITLRDWLKKIANRKRAQLPASLLQDISQYVRYNRPLQYSSQRADHFNSYTPFVASLLEYYNTETQRYEKFTSTFSRYTIDLTSALNFHSLWFCNRSGVTTNVAYNFQILEFQVDYCNSSLRFSAIRDKPNCNTHVYISNVLKK